MKISLVVCTRNRATQVVETLRRISALTCLEPWELILVDNGSTDDTGAALERYRRAYVGNVSVVVEPTAGLGRARNRGWRTSQGEIIAFTDDDCYPDSNFLDAYVRCFSEDRRLGFIGGRILLYDPTDYRITIKESERREDIPPRSFIPSGLIHGANFACRRAALEAVAGFDDLFGAGAFFPCEDVDVVARISSAGWQGAYDPRPLVFHHHRRKTEVEIARLMRQYDRGRGAYYAKCLLNTSQRPLYLRRWYWRIRSQPRAVTAREIAAGVEFLLRAGQTRLRKRRGQTPRSHRQGPELP